MNRHQHLPRTMAFALVAILASAVAPASFAQDYRYVATFNAPVITEGAVSVSNINWTCQGNTCAATGPWPKPGASACAALSAVQGAITSYGHTGAMLDPKGLDICNKRAARPPVDSKADKGANPTLTANALNPSLLKQIVPAASKKTARYLPLADKLRSAGATAAGGVSRAIKIDARSAYNDEFKAGFIVYNGTHDPAANRYVIRPATQSGGSEAMRSTSIFWRAKANTRYLLDCSLNNLNNRPFQVSLYQEAPHSGMELKSLGRFESPQNVTSVVGPFAQGTEFSMNMVVDAIGRDAVASLVAIELLGCEISLLD